MVKKVVDIIRPGRKGAFSASFSVGSKKSKKRPGRKKRPNKKGRKIPKFVWAVLPLAILLIVFLYLTFTGSLLIRAVIEQEPIELSAEAEIFIEAEAIDFDNRLIKGQVFTAEKSMERSFPATGLAIQGEKASGLITIYNNHLPAKSISLRSATRFLSAKGSKIFRIDKGVNVPAAKKEGTKTIPGEITVKAYADEEGEDYNVEASQFSVPGLAGTAYYYNVWAESEEAMAGGFKKETKQISEKDIEDAKEDLRMLLSQEALGIIKSELPSDFAFNEEAFIEDEFSASCGEDAGALKETFNCSASIKMAGISFSRNDLEELALFLLEPEVPGAKELNSESLSVDFTPKTLFVEQGKMIIKAEITAKIYAPVKEAILLSQIAGKSKSEVGDILEKDFNQLKMVELKFSPFWLNSAPSNQERLNLELTL